jgi:hypothetical protein
MLRANPQLENAVSQIQSDHRELACVITAASYASDAQDRRDQSAAGQEEMTIVGPRPFFKADQMTLARTSKQTGHRQMAFPMTSAGASRL